MVKKVDCHFIYSIGRLEDNNNVDEDEGKECPKEGPELGATPGPEKKLLAVSSLGKPQQVVDFDPHVRKHVREENPRRDLQTNEEVN